MAFTILAGMCFKPKIEYVGEHRTKGSLYGAAPRIPHKIAKALDIIVGLGVLAAGLLAMYGVIPMSSTMTQALLVGGGVYSGLMLLKVISEVKKHIPSILKKIQKKQKL